MQTGISNFIFLAHLMRVLRKLRPLVHPFYAAFHSLIHLCQQNEYKEKARQTEAAKKSSKLQRKKAKQNDRYNS